MKDWKPARLFWRLLKGEASARDYARGSTGDLNEMSRLWHELDTIIPPPEQWNSESLDRALELEKRSATPHRKARRIVWFPRLAAAMGLLALGVAIGYFLAPGNGAPEVARMADEVRQVRRMMMFSMLNRESPSERVRAVRYLRNETASDPRVKNELLKVLNADPNVTVRLESLYALAPAATRQPELRRGLAYSLLRQESTLMQISLVDLLRELDDPAATEPFRKLLERRDLNLSVRDRVQSGLNHWL